MDINLDTGFVIPIRNLHSEPIVKEAKVKKLPNGQWRVVKKDGTGNLGTYDSKEEATKRLQQVEYFKHKG